MPEMAQRASLASTASPLVSPTDRRTSSLPSEDSDPHVPDSIPPWVHLTPDAAPPVPEPVIPNTRHWRPPPAHNHKPGRKWDHLRSAEAVLITSPIAELQQEWKPFMESGPTTKFETDHEGARLMDATWYEQNMPISRRGWEESDEANVDKSEDEGGFWLLWFLSPKRRDRAMHVFWRLILKNAFVPLIFRIVVLSFTAAALGIAATIYRAINSVNSDADPNNNCSTRASTDMALIVGSIAVPYIGYVTWDEYTAKPLGLRSAFAKTSLLLVDLYFIIFAASNLSLAFDALFDRRWACYDEPYGAQDLDVSVSGICPQNGGICYKQKTLAAVLFLALIAWLITFSISVMRVVEKLRV
ncbi:hypothetical protein AMS68_005758 [Peltaster fructicola]|uniref:Uncharacterized protein n=1 Tax=Peltaster fructicola TaxID=286661 RepID=A0A6H0XZZ7_9PEZI|nr:hypothetical protein AMS68_005758 [Peltaster fructicola]